MKNREHKSKTGTEALDKATETLREVVDGVVSKLEYVEDTGIDKVSEIAGQVRELARELVAQRLDKPETAKEQALPVADAQLSLLATQFGGDVKRQLGLLLGAIDLLLAGADFLAWDFVKALQDQRDSLNGGMQSQTWEQEAAEDAEQDAASVEQIPTSDEAVADAMEQIPVSESDIADIEKRLDIWRPDKQVAILGKIGLRMPDKMREYKAETARDQARDELLNYLGDNRSYGDETAIYQAILTAAKSGNGLLELKTA